MDTPRDGGLSPQDEMRPSSIYSSRADEEDYGPPDRASILEDVVAEVVEEQNVAMSDDSEEEEDAEGSGGGDEAVTLKDRQDVSKWR